MLGNILLGNTWLGSTGTSFFVQLRRVIGTSFVEMTRKLNSFVNIVVNAAFNISDP